MNILYTKRFGKDIDSLGNGDNIKNRLLGLIEQIKQVDTLSGIPGVRKIEGFPNYFRIRVGDFRLGVKVTEDGLEMIRFLHGKEIYRRFP